MLCSSRSSSSAQMSSVVYLFLVLVLKGWSETSLRGLGVADSGGVGVSGKCVATMPMDLSVSAMICAARWRQRSTEEEGACSCSSSCRTSSCTRFSTNTKKRKATAKWTSQVRVSAAGGAEGPADDGHSWRKYGQKDILGAKHPRGYYRCTHRNSQGCPVTKQVQRTDEDPAVFDVVYRGEHTCRPASGAAKRPPQHQQHNPHAQSLLQSLSADLTVNTDSSLNATAASPLTPENRSAWGLSPLLPSPVASDSNGGLAMSPCPVIGYREWQTSDGDLQEVVSALAAVSAVPAPGVIDAEFMPYYFDFDPSFDIDPPSLFQ